MCANSHMWHVCLKKGCESVSVKLGAERGSSGEERGLAGQPWRAATFRDGAVAHRPSLFSFPFSLFVSLSPISSFFSCLSPQPPSFNPLLLQSGNKGPEYLLPHSSQPPAHLSSPALRGQGGRSDYGVQSGPLHIFFIFIFLLSLLKLILRSFPASHTPLVAANLL